VCSTYNHSLENSLQRAQLAEAFAHLGLTVFTDDFLDYAQTDPDV